MGRTDEATKKMHARQRKEEETARRSKRKRAKERLGDNIHGTVVPR